MNLHLLYKWPENPLKRISMMDCTACEHDSMYVSYHIPLTKPGDNDPMKLVNTARGQIDQSIGDVSKTMLEIQLAAEVRAGVVGAIVEKTREALSQRLFTESTSNDSTASIAASIQQALPRAKI